MRTRSSKIDSPPGNISMGPKTVADQEDLSGKLFRGICCCVLFFIAASAAFGGFYNKWHFREPGVPNGSSTSAESPGGNSGFAEMVDGTATRPFVYRQLLPSMANWLDKATPENAKKPLTSFINRRRQFQLAEFMTGSPLALNSVYSFRYLIVYVLTFLSAWLAVYAMFLVCTALSFSDLTCLFTPVLMILTIPYFMSVSGYFYDFPELAFIALAVWMGLKFDWWWLVPLVAIATWNKESFLLVTLTLYPILKSRSSQARAIAGTGLLLLTAASV